ncbi:MAG: GNAT family N-acetyltransferase [Candidatus Dadabacteria bacterium]|nr:GNAT family N-acetyltransferase [Candidatus Dadabacteria bacterium]
MRDAKKGDVDYLVSAALKLQAHHEDCNPEVWNYSDGIAEKLRVYFSEKIDDDFSKILVAEDGSGKTVGFVNGYVLCYEDDDSDHLALIERMYIEKGYRNMGIGTEFVQKLCEFFAEKGVEDISIRMVKGNIAAEKFWDKMGFKPRILVSGANRKHLEKRFAKKKNSRKMEKA